MKLRQLLYPASIPEPPMRVGGEGGGGKGGGGSEAPNTLQSRNILRILELISEGEIEGPGVGGDWNKSIQLDNGTPLTAADGTINYKGVQVYPRTGLPGQSHIEGFPDIETTYTVGLEVKNGSPGPVVRRINSAVDAVRVGIGCPALTQSDKDGNIVGSSFELKIEVKADANNGASVYVTKVQDTFKGKTTSPYQRAYRIPLSGGAPYDIRVTRVTADSTDIKVANKTTWDFYDEITDRKLIYPDSAVVGLVVNAELFGSSVPTRGYLIKGLKISVPSNYNPVTRVYTGAWDGTFVTAWSNNPAWVLYDLITHNRYGCGDWFSAAQVDKWTLYQLAQYCDAWHERAGGTTEDYDTTTGKNGVKDGLGGYEPRFTINVSIASRENAYKVLEAVAGMMRSTLLWMGGVISFVQDAPKSSSKIFTTANVIDGQFSYAGTALSARHTVCTVSWNNPAKNYATDTLMVEDSEGILRYGYNQIDVAAYGCTSYGQAYRQALYTLYTERLETDTVQFAVGFADFDLVPGEIIKIADPMFTTAAMGGRFAAVGSTTVTMDRSFAFDPLRTYTLTAVCADGTIVTRTITNPNANTASFSISVAFPGGNLPLLGGMFVIESDQLTHRTFRVMTLAEDNNTVKVTALEYSSSKFTLIDNDILTKTTAADFSDLTDPTQIAAPKTVTLEFSVATYSGVQHGELRISWTPVIDNYLHHYRVVVQQGSGNWYDLTPTTASQVTILDPQLDVVNVLIYSVSNTGLQSQAAPTSIDLTQATALNKICISNLQVVGGGSTWSGKDVYLTWIGRSPYADPTPTINPSASDPLLKNYEVRVYAADGTTLLGTFTTLTPDFTIPNEYLVAWGAARTYVVKVYYVDKNSAYSAATTLTITNPAPALPTATITRNSDTISIAFVQPSDPDFLGYRVWMSTASPVQTTDTYKVWDGAGSPTLPASTNVDYFIRYAALDVWGQTGAIISDEISVVPAVLSDIADFDCYPGEDRVRFVWEEVVSNLPIVYEIREGASWAVGVPFPRVSGNTLTVQRATNANVTTTYWIKALTADGLAESTNARMVTNYQETIPRNQIFSQDESAGTWTGTKIHFDVIGSGASSYLQMATSGGIRYEHADYITSIALGGTYYARNWIQTTWGRLTNSHTTWQNIAGGAGAHGLWNALGNTTWAPQAAPADGASLDVYIAAQSTPSDLIEGWRLASNTTGARGTTASSPAGVSTFAPCYNDNGVQLGLDSHLGWNISALSGPAMGSTFSFLVNIQPIDTTPVLVPTSMRIATFKDAGANYLYLEWDSGTGNFTLTDNAARTITLSHPTWVAGEPLCIGILQGASTRTLAFIDLETLVGNSASAAYSMAWTPTTLDIGGRYNGGAIWSDYAAVTWASKSAETWAQISVNEDKETEAVFGNAELRTTVYTYADFVIAAENRGPAGYGSWRTFLTGDYSYANALVWARLSATPDATGNITLNELFTYVDLPDITDRGSATVSNASTGVTVNFARVYHATPEITITQVGAGTVAVPVITARNSTSFTVKLYSAVDGTTLITGDVSWRAEGY